VSGDRKVEIVKNQWVYWGGGERKN